MTTATPSAANSDQTLYPALVKGAIQYRNRNGRVKRWKEYSRIVSHNYTGGVQVDSPVVNVMAARSRNIAPQLAFNDPTFDVTCVGHEPNPNSEVACAVALEKAWREEEVNPIMQRVLLDWPTIGRGVAFVGFEAAKEGQILDSKRASVAAQASIAKQGVLKATIGKIRKTLGFNTDTPVNPPSDVRTFKALQNQRVFAERVSPFDFIIDPCATSPQDATYMGRRLWLPLPRAQIMFGKDCPEATSVANIAVYADESDTDPFGNSGTVQDADKFPDEVKRVEVWEVWYITTRKTAYVSKDGHLLSQVWDWKSAHPGFPFVLVDWDEVEDCPIPEGLCAALHTLNNELNEVRKRELAELGKAWSIVTGPKTLPLEDQVKLTQSKDGAYVGIDDDAIGQIDVLQRPMLPTDVWTVESRIMANMDEASHQSAADNGGMNPVRRSATEIQKSSQGSDATMAFRQLQVEVMAEQIAERMLAAMFATFDTPVIVRIINQDGSGNIVDQAGQPVESGEEIDYPFTATEHASFYKIKVASGSMASVAGDVERQQFATVMQLLGEAPWFDAEAAGIHYLSLFPSIKDPSRFIKKNMLGANMAPTAPGQTPGAPWQQPPADPNAPQGQPVAPPTQQPQDPSTVPGMGSGNMQADILAGTAGAATAGTGVNGYPGPIQ